MKTWYHKRYLNPVRFILSILLLCVSNAQVFHNFSFKLYFLKYIFTNFCSRKPSDVGSPVLPKTQECPTLTVAAYVDLGPSRDQKGGFIYPYFYGSFMGIYQLKSHYFKEYTVQGNGYFSSRMVQGCFHADSTNRIFYLIYRMEYSPYVNSMEYTFG